MEIKKLLQIGVGKAGNVLLNEMMNLDARYVGLFINSAKGDMENLNNFTKENSFAIPQTNGSGKNRDKAREYILRWKESFFELMSSYSEFDTIVFYFSTDGGTGSGSVPTLATLTKKLFRDHYGKEVNIIAVGTTPNSSVGINGLKNTQCCWNDIVKLMNNHKDEEGNVMVYDDGTEVTPTINTLYLIDNNKKNGNYEEINAEAVETLHLAFNFNTLNTTGDLDENDSYNINISKGYNFLLKLEEAESEEQAILDAKENSVFVIPREEYYNPENVGIALKNNIFDTHNVVDLIGTAKVDVYPAPIDEDDDVDGVIFYGGIRLGLIRDYIDAISQIITDREKQLEKEIELDDDLIVSVKKERSVARRTTTSSTKVVKKEKPSITGKSRRNVRGIVSDDLFSF